MVFRPIFGVSLTVLEINFVRVKRMAEGKTRERSTRDRDTEWSDAFAFVSDIGISTFGWGVSSLMSFRVDRQPLGSWPR